MIKEKIVKYYVNIVAASLWLKIKGTLKVVDNNELIESFNAVILIGTWSVLFGLVCLANRKNTFLKDTTFNFDTWAISILTNMLNNVFVYFINDLNKYAGAMVMVIGYLFVF